MIALPWLLNITHLNSLRLYSPSLDLRRYFQPEDPEASLSYLPFTVSTHLIFPFRSPALITLIACGRV